MRSYQQNQNAYIEPQFNLIYFIVSPIEEVEKGSFISKISGKKAEVSTKSYNNIVLWDVPKGLKVRLFSEDELEAGESIQSIFFECGYDDETQKMSYSLPDRVVSSYKSAPFEPLDKLIISSYCPQRKQHCLWTCDKWGDNKQRLCFLESGANWHFDAYNQKIRIMTWGDNDIDITEIDWYN
jgi:hypothetical protein